VFKDVKRALENHMINIYSQMFRGIIFNEFKVQYLIDFDFSDNTDLDIQNFFYYMAKAFDFSAIPSLSIVNAAVEFDSYMVDVMDSKFGGIRLLEVDERLVLPINCGLRLIMTSTDVLHS